MNRMMSVIPKYLHSIPVNTTLATGAELRYTRHSQSALLNITGTMFPNVWQGGEMIVAARLKPKIHINTITSHFTARSSQGHQESIIRTSCTREVSGPEAG